ncbi:MAG: hypothetical protein AAFP77_16095 [Bacteroidota bacterium]
MPTTALGNAQANQQYIRDWTRSVRSAVRDFERKDQRRILRAVAQPIVKASRALAPRGTQPHYRYKSGGNSKGTRRPSVASGKSGRQRSGQNKGGRKGVDESRVAAVYYPGNLQKSLRTLTFRRSKDVFVGPRQGGPQRKEYGKTVGTADGYYAQMIYGSAAAFQFRVLRPALESAKAAALKKADAMRIKILERARQKGVAA